MNLDALVAPLRADVVSGAAAVSRTAAEVVRRVAVRAPAETPAELRGTLATLGHRILDAQPAMAPLVALLAHVLGSLEGVAELDEARRVSAHAAETFRGEVEDRIQKVGRRAARALPAGGRIMTLSSSSTVRAALLEAGRRGDLGVVCLEGRPMSEGQALARSVAEAGVPVTFAVDAAMEALMPGCEVLLLGADSLGDLGVVNKVGSAAAARVARAWQVPVWVLLDSTKVLPPGFPQPTADDRPADEIWRAPVGVRVWNRYFEVVPDELVDRVVTEGGSGTVDEIHESRRDLTVPAELAEWAAARRDGASPPETG